MSHVDSRAIAGLREALEGRVIEPSDPRYDAARAVYFSGFDRRPAVIVRPANAAEVARVVTLAAEGGLDLAVRGGGHSLAGHGVCEGGIVLDLSEMRGLEIDLDDRSAWAETGLTAGAYTEAAGAHGLATGFGDAGSVGIGGITLGGGVGFLHRRHGLTIDSLLSAEMVTADGRVLQIDEERHPDLFWAIRGGGGNFGVATRLRFRLHEVDAIVGGIMLLPATADVIASLVEESRAAPEELTTILMVMRAPPIPFVPSEHHGRLVVMAMPVWAGPIEAGRHAVARLRAVATPIVDMVQPMRYAEIYSEEEERPHPAAVAVRSFLADHFDRDAARAVLDQLETAPPGMSSVQIRVLGGAVARVAPEATAFAHRSRGLIVNVGAAYDRPDEAEGHEAWTAGCATALRRDERGAYVGFLANGGEERVREAYPGATWDRLVEIKARYDPANLFRLNQNVPPSPRGAAPSANGRPTSSASDPTAAG